MRGSTRLAVSVAAACWLAPAAFGQAPARAVEPAHAPLVLRAPVRDKNFYLLSKLEETPAAAAAVRTDPRLARLAAARRDALDRADRACGNELLCYPGAMLWNETDIAEASAALKDIYGSSQAVRDLVDGPLRISGLFVRYRDSSGAEFLAQAWEDAARGINNMIEVYGAGKPPRYPNTDSISYDTKLPAFLLMTRTLTALLNEDSPRLELFFQPSLRFALGMLDANHRDEAGRLEPLESGENAAALQRIRTLDWSRYPYTAIMVPGSGPDRLTFTLSAIGKLRLEIAARRFREGKAPLMIVSGGFVYPAQTGHAEALEMKRSLMADFGVPADAILIEPQARHTTTNIRNVSRLMYRYGVPFDRPSLLVTDMDHSRTIESPAFRDRCIRELGYVPFEVLKRLSRFDLEWLPKKESLQADSRDPLDP
jgi:hypothetical protein